MPTTRTEEHTMKIAVHLTVDIDPADWTLNYGITDAAAIRAELREDVRAAAEAQLQHAVSDAITVTVAS